MNGAATAAAWVGARGCSSALVLILAGAGAAVWGLAHYQPAARFLGIASAGAAGRDAGTSAGRERIRAARRQLRPNLGGRRRSPTLEQRVDRVENATQRAEGSAGRADALVVAFAARRAIDRGVALGYLENLLVERFGAAASGRGGDVITASHQPVRLERPDRRI